MRNHDYLNQTDLDERATSWLERIRSEVAPKPQFVLKPETSALLIVDMLHYFADPAGRCYLPVTALIIPRIASLIAAWRRFNGTVIYTRHCHEGKHDLGLMGKFYTDFIHSGLPEAEIIAPLKPAGDDIIIPKKTYDAFQSTPLQETLLDRNITQLTITGILTHMCCESTARAAFCRGFEVYLPVDAMASNREERHLNSLIAMADCIGSVTSVAEVLKSCNWNR